ncbi:hypothetical protein [Nitrospira moscoviensis]|uniref:Uncharacterized protein n=1 Tax=Nitrospira moscoviensis TaxID=42253 RepID=A0A0K2G942_NITMO|nr:hypothetical protein [Nitrospira moscoviensis]ALA57445.1 conserved exported protein of unknown function [Nitrospira moscoviensis]
MKTTKTMPVMVGALAILALAMGPAWAKDSKKESKKPAGHKSASAAAAAAGAHISDPGHAPKSGQHDTKPGPAWKTVGGTVKSIHGDMYLVEDYEGNQVQLYVGQGTKHLRGNKKVGDTVRAEITRGGFANSIQ